MEASGKLIRNTERDPLTLSQSLTTGENSDALSHLMIAEVFNESKPPPASGFCKTCLNLQLHFHCFFGITVIPNQTEAIFVKSINGFFFFPFLFV